MTGGISQYASAAKSGNASNSIANDGGMYITASANATGSAYATAYALVDVGIVQQAIAPGDASNSIANDGTLSSPQRSREIDGPLRCQCNGHWRHIRLPIRPRR